MKKVKREAYRGLYLIYKILMLFRKKRDEDSKKTKIEWEHFFIVATMNFIQQHDGSMIFRCFGGRLVGSDSFLLSRKFCPKKKSLFFLEPRYTNGNDLEEVHIICRLKSKQSA